MIHLNGMQKNGGGQMSECKYCGGDCHEQVLKNGEPRAEFLCDGYAGDIDNLYGDRDGKS